VEIPSIHRAASGYGYKYATLDDVVSITTPILAKHGLAIVHTFSGRQLTTTLLHESGESISSVIDLPALQLKGMNDAQALGSAITYCRRYNIGALLNLALDDDTDAQSEPQKAQPKPEPVKAEKAKPEPSKAVTQLAKEAQKAVTVDDLIALSKRWEGYSVKEPGPHIAQGIEIIAAREKELFA
jgi:hypothetical protein